jgi:hypothetical protein
MIVHLVRHPDLFLDLIQEMLKRNSSVNLFSKNTTDVNNADGEGLLGRLE